VRPVPFRVSTSFWLLGWANMLGCVDAAHEKSVTRNVDANKCRGKSQLLPVAMVAERPFAARKNGPFSRFITDEKSISHETQRGSFALALIKWVDEENFCPKPLSFG
jgi:hypothetical protein